MTAGVSCSLQSDCVLLTLCSDNVARVFTSNPERQAAGSEIEQLQEEAGSFKSVIMSHGVTGWSHAVTGWSHGVTGDTCCHRVITYCHFAVT